jgi:hypothetical protein
MVSPGCVTDPAKAIEISIHIDSTPAVIPFVNLLGILASDAGSPAVRGEQRQDRSMKIEADVSSLGIVFKISRLPTHRA